MRKEWPGQGVFNGRVVAYKHNLYQVRYEDEDEEEMTREEVLECRVDDDEGSGSETEKDDEHDRRRRGRQLRGLDTDTEVHRSDANDEPEELHGPAPEAKRRKLGRDFKSCPLDLSDVPMNLPPIPSDRPGSASRFKGVTKHQKKWMAQIKIPSEGGNVCLGIFDSEEEAGIMHARARYKHPDARF